MRKVVLAMAVIALVGIVADADAQSGGCQIAPPTGYGVPTKLQKLEAERNILMAQRFGVPPSPGDVAVVTFDTNYALDQLRRGCPSNRR